MMGKERPSSLVVDVLREVGAVAQLAPDEIDSVDEGVDLSDMVDESS